MEKFLNDALANQIGGVLKQMINPVTIELFVDKNGCQSCSETTQLLQEIAGTTSKITLKTYTLQEKSELAKKYDISLTPCFVMLDAQGQYKGVKFNGIPAGHEINSFISALLDMSGLKVNFPQTVIDRIAKIKKPVSIKVFVTLSCPHCPGAVQNAHRLAMLNPNIKSEMIEANTFGALSQKYKVSGVPKIVINDRFELLGNQPVDAFLKEIEKI